ncbi:MAG TPA: histidine kinase dimerization/phospho-acceptor domain-containing protein, partial [Actinomycetota bacterium]|nr:histidine kinase dimerization/phospho-acceptor domain-containing protein [Actinomycetota bacterium]
MSTLEVREYVARHAPRRLTADATPAGSAPRRGLRIHRWTALFLTALLALSATVSLLTVRVIHSSEDALLSEQTQLIGSTLSALIGQVQSDFFALGMVATVGGPAVADPMLAGIEKEGLSPVLLLRRSGAQWVAADADAAPVVPLTDTSSPIVQKLDALQPGAFEVLGFSGTGNSEVISLASLPAGSAYAVYAELPLGILQSTTSSSEAPGWSNVAFALYVNGREQPADMVMATTKHLPLSSARAIVELNLEAQSATSVTKDPGPGKVRASSPDDLLLIASAQGQPLGWLAGNLFWIFLAAGLAGSLVLAAALEMLLRRRDLGITMVADLEANNAALDRALDEQARVERDRSRLEDQLRQAQRLEAVGQLAGGIAHDFNNLLAVILGNGDFALDALATDDPARADIEEMVQAAQRAAELTRQLLIFSRKDIVRPTAVDLNRVVDSTSRLL